MQLVFIALVAAFTTCEPHRSTKIDESFNAESLNVGIKSMTKCLNKITVWRTRDQFDRYLIEHLENVTSENCHNEMKCLKTKDTAFSKRDSLEKEDSLKKDSMVKNDSPTKEDYLHSDDSLKENSLTKDSTVKNDSPTKEDFLHSDDFLKEDSLTKEPCTCETSKETFYAREIYCKYGFDQVCPFCFSTSPTQPILVNLLENTKENSVGRLMRCQGGGPIPPVRIVANEGGEEKFENCKVNQIEYENIDVKDYSKWRILDLTKTRFKFYYVQNDLKWTGNECEWQSLNGLVLKLKIDCENKMEAVCTIIKTEGKSTAFTNNPNKIQEDLDKCQKVGFQTTIIPTPSSTSVKEEINPVTVVEEPKSSQVNIITDRLNLESSLLRLETYKTNEQLTTKVNEQSQTIKKPFTQSESTYKRIVSQSQSINKNFDQSTSDIVLPLESLMVISAADLTKASVFLKMNYYPSVNTQGNNGILILIASITAAISLVMVLITILLVVRRDRREKEQNKDEYSNSEYSTYGDDRSRSESMFEVARKIYIVEKRGSVDYNLNVGTPPESILKTPRKESDMVRRGNEIRPRNKSKSSFANVDVSLGIQAISTQTEEERPKRKETCDCATYTDHDIPTLVAAPMSQTKVLSDPNKMYSRRRKTWNWFESSKKLKSKKTYNIEQKSKEANVIVEVSLKKMKKISQTSTESFSNPIHDEIKSETAAKTENTELNNEIFNESNFIDHHSIECGIDNEAYSRSESIHPPSQLKAT